MHRIGFIVPDRFQLMSLAALTAFEIANLTPAGCCYDIRLLSEYGGPVQSSAGMTLNTETFGDPSFDTIVVGSISIPTERSPGSSLTQYSLSPRQRSEP